MAITVKEIMDRLKEPIGVLSNTVDSLKSGDPDMEVKGIATSFMPTQYVIRESVKIGANLLITHEGLFYRHLYQTELDERNSVGYEKSRLIDKSGIAIFRFHDYWHRYQPDGIMAGLISCLGWESFVKENRPAATIVTIPAMSLAKVAEHLKKQLGIEYVRVSGNEKTMCSKIGLLAGYRGSGELTIPLFEKDNLDLLIYGEGPEWETPEYVRDAIYQGKNKSLIVLGHAESETSGMKYLAQYIQKIYPQIPVHFIPENPIFRVL